MCRLKKIMEKVGEACGISKQINWEGGGFFKYYELTYEDALRNMRQRNTPVYLIQKSF